jgi:hypothetical protein
MPWRLARHVAPPAIAQTGDADMIAFRYDDSCGRIIAEGVAWIGTRGE